MPQASSLSPSLAKTGKASPLAAMLEDSFLEALASLRGVDFALDFAQARGGYRLYVPSTGAGALRGLVGDTAARALARDWGGLHVEVHHAVRARIARMALRGLSVSAIAHACGRSRRYVRAQLARFRAGAQAL